MKQQTHTTSSQGYAILFAVLLISIILAIALGILNIALKEFNFTATARNSHVGFFAADTGGECALYAKKNGMLNGASVATPPSMTCDTQTVTSTGVDLGNSITQFTFQPISVQDGCSVVDIVIDNSNTQISKTTINAHGYNIKCNQLSNNAVQKTERLLTYEFTDIGAGSGGTSGGTTGGATGTGGTTGFTPINLTGGINILQTTTSLQQNFGTSAN